MPADILEPDVASPAPARSDHLTDQIGRLLRHARAGLKQRIWQETWLRVFVSLFAWFLVMWALDYLPIWVGVSELPVAARAGSLGLLLVGLLAIVFYWGWRRASVPVNDLSLALLIEKQYPELADRLATWVFLEQQQGTLSQQDEESVQQWERQSAMRSQSGSGLLQPLQSIEIGTLFDWNSVRFWRNLAVGVALATLLAAVIWPTWLVMALRREVLLDARRWPRQSDIQLVGLEPELNSRLLSLLEQRPALLATEGRYRVGRGSQIQVLVQARKGDSDTGHSSESRPDADDASLQFSLPGRSATVPERCLIDFQQDQEDVRRHYMTRMGALSATLEGFRYEGPPLQPVDQSMSLTIYGGDDRIGPVFLDVVDTVALVQLELECRFPNYLEISQGTRWLPQTMTWTEGLRLPEGTAVHGRFQFSKPVRRLLLLNRGASEVQIDWQDQPRRQVTLDLGIVSQDQAWELWAQDVDHLWTSSAMIFPVTVQEDLAPLVQAEVQGVETAVTPDARIPIVCLARDDHQLQSLRATLKLPVTWLGDQPSHAIPNSSDPSAQRTDDPISDSRLVTEIRQDLIPDRVVGNNESDDSTAMQPFQTVVDLRDWQQAFQTTATLAVDQQQVIQLNVTATDYFQPADIPGRDGEAGHPTNSHAMTLEVVSPATLLRLLKRSEVGQRQRLEQIYQELLDQRFYLGRCQNLLDETELAKSTPEVKLDSDSDDTTSSAASWDRLAVFARRAATQNEKSRRELSGVQAAFQRMIQQIENNRLEAAEYRRRLQFRVVDVMDQLGEREMVASGQRIQQLEESLREAGVLKETEDATGWEAPAGVPSEESIDALTRSTIRQQIQQAMQQNDRCIDLLDQVLRDLLKFESDSELYELVRQLFDQQKRLLEETERRQQQQAFDELFGN